MAIEKKTVKKSAAAQPAKPKPAAKKPAAKQAPAKTTAKKASISQETFYAMVSEAAYFMAQNDGNRKGCAEYWIAAESEIRAKFNVA